MDDQYQLKNKNLIIVSMKELKPKRSKLFRNQSKNLCANFEFCGLKRQGEKGLRLWE